MKIVFFTLFILTKLTINCQEKVFGFNWNLTPQQDLAFDYYSNGVGVYCISKLVFKCTKKPVFSALIGLALGISRSLFLERGVNGKIVSGSGAVGGNFVFDIDLNLKHKKEMLYESKFEDVSSKMCINEL